MLSGCKTATTNQIIIIIHKDNVIRQPRYFVKPLTHFTGFDETDGKGQTNACLFLFGHELSTDMEWIRQVLNE